MVNSTFSKMRQGCCRWRSDSGSDSESESGWRHRWRGHCWPARDGRQSHTEWDSGCQCGERTQAEKPELSCTNTVTWLGKPVQSFAKIHGELISLRLKKETEMFRFKELKCATALFIFSGMCFAVQMWCLICYTFSSFNNWVILCRLARGPLAAAATCASDWHCISVHEV